MERARSRNWDGPRKHSSTSCAGSWSRPTSGETKLASRSERVLLTGSGGFTGRPLAERLRHDGHQVVGLTRHPGEAGEMSGDLCDAAWVRKVVGEIKPSIVLHLAGITTTLHADISEVYAINVVGTVNLLAALA